MSRDDAPNFRTVGLCCNCIHYQDGYDECEKHKFSLEGLDGNLAMYKVCDDWE